MIKKRIRNGEIVGYKYVKKHNNISPCLLLYFKTEPMIKPIRKPKFKEYRDILVENGVPEMEK